MSDAADPNVPDKGAFLPGSAAYGKQPTKVPQVLDVDGDGEVTVEALNGQWQNPQGIGAAELLDVLRIRQQWSGLTDDASLVADARDYLGLDEQIEEGIL